MDYIKYLPNEIQKKILYLSMIHPTCTIIKNLKKDIIINNLRINIDSGKYEPLSFYEALRSLNYLNGQPHRCCAIHINYDDFIDFLIHPDQWVENF